MLAFARTVIRGTARCELLCRDTFRESCLRYTSTVRTSPTPDKTVDKDESRNFMNSFSGIVKDLTDAGHDSDIPDVQKRLVQALEYNVPGGKKNRGLSLVQSYKILASKTGLTEENLKLSYILGWCVEIFQAYQLVIDDIMDNSITRRGLPCWYRHNDIGLQGINDGILLNNTIYQLTQKYFKDKPYYVHILELLHDVEMKTTIGQSLDMITAHKFRLKQLENVSMENYEAIVKYKTAYYSFLLPVCLAMRMANIDDPEMFRQAKTILIEMGHLFQVQDDFLDCYGDPVVMGKIGTDIEDGKCSWLAVVALQNVNPQQKKIFEDNYGIGDPTNVAIIKDLYEELKLPNIFRTYEEESFNKINTHIQEVSLSLPQDMFLKFLDKINKRKL